MPSSSHLTTALLASILTTLLTILGCLMILVVHVKVPVVPVEVRTAPEPPLGPLMEDLRALSSLRVPNLQRSPNGEDRTR